MSTSPSDDLSGAAASPADGSGDPGTGRSGTTFVIAAAVFLVLFLAFILVVSPRLQDQLGLTEGARPLPTPDQAVEVPLALGGEPVGVATWDAQGVCAEVTDSSGTTFRTCAQPDVLRPIWAIDAPDEADPAYLIVATPPQVASIAGLSTDGEGLNGLVQARELPAGWALIPLPPGAVVDQLLAQDADGRELGDAACGGEAATGGSDRLGGGCVVPRQD